MHRRHSIAFFRLISCLLIALSSAGLTALYAQYTTATLGGTVVDSSGASIPNAKVTAHEMQTGFERATSTMVEGRFTFPRLPVGEYRLVIEKVGFQTYTQEGITLSVSQAAMQFVTLQPGSLTQSVTISANAELVATGSAAVGQLITRQNITELPLNGREVQSLVFLSPGTTNVTEHYCGVGCEGGVYPGEQYASVSGTTSNGVAYMLDGVAHNDPYINSNLPFPNPDSVQEFNVQTANLSAEYGNAASAVVNIVSRSGTNQIHGDLFEFVRNGSLNARNFFAPTTDTLKRNQYGGAVGGPIKRDQLFFFGTYQGTPIRQASQGQIAFVPTPAERNGDFSDLLPTRISDPTSKAPFPNNQIPNSQLSPVAQYLLQYIPVPNGPGHQLTYVGPSLVQNDYQFMTKADWNRVKNQLSGRYFFTNFSQPPQIAKTNLVAADPNAQKVRIQNFAINHTYNASAGLLFNTWIGVTRQIGGALSSAPFGMNTAGVKMAVPQTPEISLVVPGFFSIQTGHLGEFNRGEQNFRENVTMIRGAHEMHFGGEALRVRTVINNQYFASGNFRFANQLSGSNLADLLLGQVSLFRQNSGGASDWEGIDWSLFFQDNWRLNRRLILNAGIRWDPYFPYGEAKGRNGCFEPGRQSSRYPNAPLGLLYGGSKPDPGCPSATVQNNVGNFAPRLGFAYRLTEDGKTSLRGGAGFYYQMPNTVAHQDEGGLPPFSTKFAFNVVSLADPYGSVGVTNPFPASFGSTVPGPQATFTPPLTVGGIFSQQFRASQIAIWNITLERQVAQSWLIRAAYVGNKGTHLFGTGDQEGGSLQANPAVYIPGSSTIANTNARRIYPQFTSVVILDSEINSHYNGLQLALEKRLSHGISFLANYTWSKAMNDFSPLSQQFSTNPFNRRFDYGVSNDDLSSVFKASGVYQFPRANVRGIPNRLINGWELTSILVWQGGFPFSVFSGLDNSFSGIGEDRADFVGSDIHSAQLSSARPHGQLIQQWFNTSLFVPNAIGTFGNAGKNVLRGPRMFNTDLGLVKNTRITETTSVQFRAEFFNAFNDVNFLPPNNNVAGGGFGKITAARDPRILQFALKFAF